MAAPIPQSFHLFGHALCPFSNRATMAVIETGLSPFVTYTHTGLGGWLHKGDMSAWYIANINPGEFVPALLEHSSPLVKVKKPEEIRVPKDGRVILESLDICKYLSSIQQQDQVLYPVDPELRAQVDAFLKATDDLNFYTSLSAKPGEEQQKELEKTSAALIAAEAVFDKSNAAAAVPGPFLLGARYSLGDLALVPFLERFRSLLGKFADGFVVLDEKRWPKITAMFAAATTRPSYLATALPASYYLEYYDHALYPYSEARLAAIAAYEAAEAAAAAAK